MIRGVPTNISDDELKDVVTSLDANADIYGFKTRQGVILKTVKYHSQKKVAK